MVRVARHYAQAVSRPDSEVNLPSLFDDEMAEITSKCSALTDPEETLSERVIARSRETKAMHRRVQKCLTGEDLGVSPELVTEDRIG